MSTRRERDPAARRGRRLLAVVLVTWLMCAAVVGPVDAAVAIPARTEPVVFGGAEISVPASWLILGTGSSGCPSRAVVVLVDGGRLACNGAAPPAGTVTFGAESGGRAIGTRLRIHGLEVRISVLHGSCSGELAIVPSLLVELRLCGTAPHGLVDTLRLSPASAVVAAGPMLSTPSSWRSTTFDGLSFSTPPSWPVDSDVDIGARGCSTTRVRRASCS